MFPSCHQSESYLSDHTAPPSVLRAHEPSQDDLLTDAQEDKSDCTDNLFTFRVLPQNSLWLNSVGKMCVAARAAKGKSNLLPAEDRTRVSFVTASARVTAQPRAGKFLGTGDSFRAVPLALGGFPFLPQGEWTGLTRNSQAQGSERDRDRDREGEREKNTSLGFRG